MQFRSGKRDIVIRVHIRTKENGIDAKTFIKIFDVIEKALYQSDYEDIIRYFNKSEIPTYELIRDAALERLRSKRHRRLKLVDTKEGSIVIYGLVTAVSIFVLKKTIGESLGRGYKDSDLDEKLTTFFRDVFNGKRKSVLRHLRNLFITDFDEEVEVSRNFDKEENLNLIDIDIYESQIKNKEPIPSWDEILNEPFKF